MLYFWLVMIIVLAIIEAATINLVTIWFIASALVSLVLSIFTDNVFIQFLVFVLLGIILLLLTRKTLLRLLNVHDEKTNADMVIGKDAIVTEEIKKNKPGEVSVLGKKWTAISEEEIKKDEVVEVLEIEGVKLKVRKKKEMK